MNSLDLQLLTNTLITFFTNNAHLLPNYVPDASKVSILLWAVKDKSNTFILKIADQKYVSDYRIDKNGESYWKFKEVEESKTVKNSDPEPQSGSTSPLPESDSITKFKQRQEKTEQIKCYAKSNPEPATINSPEQSESVSQ